MFFFVVFLRVSLQNNGAMPNQRVILVIKIIRDRYIPIFSEALQPGFARHVQAFQKVNTATYTRDSLLVNNIRYSPKNVLVYYKGFIKNLMGV